MICGKCDTQIPEESIYCPECGCRLVWEEEFSDQVMSAEDVDEVELDKSSMPEVPKKKLKRGSEKVAVRRRRIAFCVFVLLWGAIFLARYPGVFSYLGKKLTSLVAPSNGLRMELSANENYYIVVGFRNNEAWEVTVPKTYRGLPVREVAENAFEGCENLECITIPKTVETVGAFAFDGCKNLYRLEMPGVMTLDKNALTGCPNIEEITIPAEQLAIVKKLPIKRIVITHIEDTCIPSSVFKENLTLREVVIESGITSIGEEAFMGCESLATVILPKGLLKIGMLSFAYCKELQAIELPKGLETVGRAAFRNCESITEMVVPGSVTTIPALFCAECVSLKKLTIENGVEKIGDYDDLSGEAFGDCSISSVSIPESVEYIEEYAFRNNPLVEVEFEDPIGWRLTDDSMLTNDYCFFSSELKDTTYAASLLLYIGEDGTWLCK